MYFFHGPSPLQTPGDRVTFFLVALATFHHDASSKTDVVPDLEARRRAAGADVWTIFFCLMDLLAEIRVIWDVAKRVNGEGPYMAANTIDIWLPFAQTKVEESGAGAWKIEFWRTSDPSLWGPEMKSYDRGAFSCALATGDDSRLDVPSKAQEVAAKKKEQYESLLRLLGLNVATPVKVNCN